jgi:hypothetical protein
LKVYSKSEIKTQFLNAHKSLIIKKEISDDETYYRPLIKIFDRQVFVYVFVMFWDTLNDKMMDDERKQKTIETIQQSEIYKLATNE